MVETEESLDRERFDSLLRMSKPDAHCSTPVIALLRADGRVTRALDEALAPAGLTGPKFNVLMLLASSGGRLALCGIAERLLKSPPNVTALIDRLERDGMVLRVRSEKDRRMVLAEITELGWQALEKGAGKLFDAERRILLGLSDAERAGLAGMLDRVAPAAQPGG
jgi:DNA-binding MarR family transcriptional regulator